MHHQPGVRATLRALLRPSRLLPTALAVSIVVLAQAAYNHAPHRVALAIALCGGFVLIAPVAWRVLFHTPSAMLHTLVLCAIYLAIAVGVVSAFGLLVPRWLGLEATLLTEPMHLVVCVGLFVAGGWGLGRHISLEESLRIATDRLAHLQVHADHAQLLALRAQLDPHFLFNTLNAIAEWCLVDGAVAERAVLQLSSMLRAVLAGVRAPAWTLREELALVKDLCDLHRLRDPGLFEMRVSCDALVEVKIPSMILLPLVENAIKHGPMAGHRGLIQLTLTSHEDELRVSLSNPGPYRGPRPGSEGLPTLQRRLALAYRARARFDIAAVGGPRTQASLALPFEGALG